MAARQNIEIATYLKKRRDKNKMSLSSIASALFVIDHAFGTKVEVRFKRYGWIDSLLDVDNDIRSMFPDARLMGYASDNKLWWEFSIPSLTPDTEKEFKKHIKHNCKNVTGFRIKWGETPMPVNTNSMKVTLKEDIEDCKIEIEHVPDIRKTKEYLQS